jgi:transcriptional regulator with XRE-family HTH domain
VLFLKGSRFLKQDLSEICRNKKESRYPNMTYQDLANASGKSLKNIGQFMRGEILNPGIDTVGPVCRLLHISLDRFFDIHPDDVPPESDIPQELHDARKEIEHLRQTVAFCQQSMKLKRKIIAALLGIVFLAGILLLVDLLSPKIGWVRDHLTAAICLRSWG